MTDAPLLAGRSPIRQVGAPTLTWWKRLAPTDALRNPGNPRAYVQLTRSGHAIDHTMWFRHELFVDASWAPAPRGGGEDALIDFDVTFLGVRMGVNQLRVTCLARRAAHHRFPTTRLYWNTALRSLLGANDCTSKYLVLTCDSLDQYGL